MDLSGTSALVTGGAGMLGSQTVRRLVKRGAHVVVVDLDRAKEPFEALAAELGAEHVTFAPVDVRDPEAVADAVAQAAEHGPLRVVVNCAGAGMVRRMLSPDGEVHPLEEFQFMVDLNLVGTFNVMSQAARVMARTPELEEGQRGVIVNISSLAGVEGSAGQTAYGAAKAGVAGLTLPAARDLGPIGIRVNAIAPNGMAPEGALDGQDVPPHIERILEQVAFPKRFGTPDEFATIVETFVDVTYLNGVTLRLDGAGHLPRK
ncbi:MAG TPA: SDR family NAD(P)-dependent oxidoreductase [Nitriliruptorales bacterium]